MLANKMIIALVHTVKILEVLITRVLEVVMIVVIMIIMILIEVEVLVTTIIMDLFMLYLTNKGKDLIQQHKLIVILMLLCQWTTHSNLGILLSKALKLLQTSPKYKLKI